MIYVLVSSSVISCVHAHTAESALAAALKEHCLTVQDFQGLLQSCDFCSAALHALLVSLSLCNASLLQAVIIFVHCIKFLLDSSSVCSCLSGLLVEPLELLCLIFHVLLLCGLGDLVL